MVNSTHGPCNHRCRMLITQGEQNQKTYSSLSPFRSNSDYLLSIPALACLPLAQLPFRVAVSVSNATPTVVLFSLLAETGWTKLFLVKSVASTFSRYIMIFPVTLLPFCQSRSHIAFNKGDTQTDIKLENNENLRIFLNVSASLPP